MTGSYLGKTLEREYFLPAGDVEKLVLNSLSYEEFLYAAGKYELYKRLSCMVEVITVFMMN